MKRSASGASRARTSPRPRSSAGIPRWKDELEVLLGCDRLLRPMARAAELPEVGEHLGPFFLLCRAGPRRLGQDLPGLGADPGGPAGRPEGHLRRPGGAPLAGPAPAHAHHPAVLRALVPRTRPAGAVHALPGRDEPGADPRGPRADPARGSPGPRHPPCAGSRAGRPGREPMQPDGPYRRYLEQAAYVEAICWIGTRLADALHEAHAHGLVHMDVKPSNVLIAADGLPMLLDFHLACRPIPAGERFPDRIGGTPGWMAPEHRAALEAVARRPTGPRARSTTAPTSTRWGCCFARRSAGPGGGLGTSAGRHRCDGAIPAVSVGLADIIARCLAERPADRYPRRRRAGRRPETARSNDLPLRGVRNRLSERIHKWRKRNPAGPFAVAGLVVLAAVGASLAFFYFERFHEVRDGARGRSRVLRERAICGCRPHLEPRTGPRPGYPLPRVAGRHLKAQLREARRGEDAETLHYLAERVRFEYGIDPHAPDEAGTLLRDIRAIWARRHQLLSPLAGDSDSSLDQQIRTDLLELVGVWADLTIRLTSQEGLRDSRFEILHLLDEAQANCGPSFTIDRLRRLLVGNQAARPQPEDRTRSQSPHRSITTWADPSSRSKEFDRASKEFGLALDRRPQDFWPNFYAGHCAYRLERYSDAFAWFSVCIALDPQSAPSYFNRALAAKASGRTDQAFRDYTHALGLDPRLTNALLNRGILSYNSGRYLDAIADFRHAIDTASDPDTLGRVHYNLALAHLARGDRPSARISAEQAVAQGNEDARRLRDQLRRDR